MHAIPHANEELFDIFKQLQEIGLREYQESIHYLTFLVAVLDDAGEQSDRERTKKELYTLRDLADKIHQMELIMQPKQLSEPLATVTHR